MIGGEEAALPEGFKLVYGPSWRFGTLRLASREASAAFWVEARGFVIPRLIRVDLEYAGAFGRGHPEGWDYVVDARKVRFVHPWNLTLLARVRGLPHIRSWTVITSPGFSEGLLKCAPSRIRPDYIVHDVREALVLLDNAAEERAASEPSL